MKSKAMLALLLLEHYTKPLMNSNRLKKTEEGNNLWRQAAAIGGLSEEGPAWIYAELK